MEYIYLGIAIGLMTLLGCIFTPFGVAALTGAALLVMSPGLIQCAYMHRWP